MTSIKATNINDKDCPKTKVLFIAGWGRSGSTVIANILGSHPSIQNLGEVRYLWDRAAIENRTCGCGEAFSTCDLWASHVKTATENCTPVQYRDTIGSRGKWRQLKALLFSRAAKQYYVDEEQKLNNQNSILSDISEVSAVPVLIDASKTPLQAINYLKDPRIEVFVLHLVRDPRAVALSWKRSKERKEGVSGELMPQYSIGKSIIFWNALNLLCLRLRKLVGKHNYTYLSYEEFVQAPQTTINSILNEVELPTSGVKWENYKKPFVTESHSISGNPIRHRLGTIEIKEDDAYKTELSGVLKATILLLTSPTKVILQAATAVGYIRSLCSAVKDKPRVTKLLKA